MTVLGMGLSNEWSKTSFRTGGVRLLAVLHFRQFMEAKGTTCLLKQLFIYLLILLLVCSRHYESIREMVICRPWCKHAKYSSD